MFNSFSLVPLAPELHLEPLNCTTILVRWQLGPKNSASVQGYRLFYHEESQSESAPVQLRASDKTHTIEGLGEFRLCDLSSAVALGKRDTIQYFHYFLMNNT